jgi:YfiH family protein
MILPSPLPSPQPPFEWLETAAGPALVCRKLAPVARHLFTSRRFALGTPHASADGSSEAAAWTEIARTVDVRPECLVRVHQVHGADVVVASRPAATLPHADIVVGDDDRFTMAVQVADCVPLLIADRRTRACAAAHAGWRGVAARVPGAAVKAMAEKYGSRPSDLTAAIGPSIGACCYEVRDDVRDRFRAAGHPESDIARWFLPSPRPTATNPSLTGLSSEGRPEHWYVDLWQAVRDQLETAGVPAKQIYAAGLCTASHRDVFCSYRRDGSGAGRLAGVIRPGPSRP